MFISEMLNNDKVTVSFEVFPPKADSSFDVVKSAIGELNGLHPDYMSVTYGAGGSTSKRTADIASHIQNELGTNALAHLSCIAATHDQISEQLKKLKNAGIENILALRGDIPESGVLPAGMEYHYAWQLVEDIKKEGGFCVGAACYPEGHVECLNKTKDLDYLKQKVDCGCDFLVTQMFFDNNVLYTFLYNALKAGIEIPVTAGIMPVTNSKQISKICSLSGTSLTPKFRAILDKFGDNPAALKQAGIAYAVDQIVDMVSNGIKGIHVYTMNKPDVAKSILNSLSAVLGRD